ncbi:hypothetical protein GCM10023093_31860 [Nemorincola caseinilytica]|uniref:DUF5723 domain-containing protein n=1 Tax=Nemorincola caseinilytica TaxID=2054315 RepID=A0ABP8NP20_9BACT
MRRPLFLFILLIASSAARAQHNLAIAYSNWSCINGIFLNPASIAEMKEKRSVSALAASFYVDNNVGPFNASEGLVVAVGDGKTNNMFSYKNNSKISMMAPYFNMIGPGAVKRLDSASSIAITTRLRGMNQFNFFDQTIFHAFNDPKYAPEQDMLSLPRDFVYTVHFWMELGGSYARTVYNKDGQKLKLGGTFRYLLGLAYVGVQGTSMNTTFTKGQTTFHSENTDIEYASNVLNTYTYQGSNFSQNFINLIRKGKFGHGIGGDIGAVYELKAKGAKAREGYKTKVSLSICDVGAIFYSKKVNTNQVINGSGNVSAKGILDNVKNFANMEKYVEKQGFTATTRNKSTVVYMPAHLILSGDHHLKKQYYVTAMTVINLANRHAYGNSFYNQFSIIPRYETKNLTMGLPITYGILSHSLKVGAGISFHNFYIGSDDMLGFVSKSQYGINIYAGVTKRFYK